MTRTYEGMFLLDNQAVREDWKAAKRLVTDTIAKHGGAVLTARRFDERKLAYPIQGKRRGTYLLVWFEQEGTAASHALRREFDLSERVLRYLILKSEGIPAGERELSEAENASDFVIPAPPPDDSIDDVEDVPLGGSGEESSEEASEGSSRGASDEGEQQSEDEQ